jgi:hypothetical protein
MFYRIREWAMKNARYLAKTVFLLILGGCASLPELSDFQEFKIFRNEEVALEKRAECVKPPIIFIPGIKGSLLVNPSGRVRWGLSHRGTFLHRYDELLLDIDKQLCVDDEASFSKWCRFYKERGIQEDKVLYAYKISFSQKLYFGDFSVYDKLHEELISTLGYHEDRDLFMMPYDWRLDNRVAAVKLGLVLEYWSDTYERYLRVKFCKNDPALMKKVWKNLKARG